MISKEAIEDVKEALYMNCLSKKFCCLCLEGLKHNNHCFHSGSLRIGGLNKLRFLINNVINDTSEQRFRIYECMRYLESQGYLVYKVPVNKMAETIFYCTPKLIIEMREKQANPTETLNKWY